MSSSESTRPATPHLDAAKEAMLGKTRKSTEMTGDREALLFSGMRANMLMPHPIYIASGEGARVTDIDGNEYIDTVMGFGACVLGHRHPDIAEAIHRVVASRLAFRDPLA